MRFVHLADAHIGGWKDPRMRVLVNDSFIYALDFCLEKNVDFLLIAGDLFNSSHPTIDDLKLVVQKLKELKDRGIETYAIAGSHDFSASGKTMLDVLEEAGLLHNVVRGRVLDEKLILKFSVNQKTGAKITGMLGKKGMLDRKYYETLNTDILEKEEGFKIFLFHTSITELKPQSLEKMDSSPISLLPKGFDYYAGGHVHIVENKTITGYKNVIYPGPVFPMNLHEFEELGNGSIFYYDEGKIEKIDLPTKNKLSIKINVDKLDSQKAKEKIIDEIKNREYSDSIVMMRIEGELSAGKTSDINFQDIVKMIYEKQAYFVMKNTSKLTSKEFEEIKTSHLTTNDIEEKIIDEHIGKSQVFIDKDEEKNMIIILMKTLSVERKEGEKIADYEKKIKDEMNQILKI